ncbi:SGNH/GDSL hydrolase family protein [Candidatus Cardinium hertigii]|nr:SGNH/GDSL hydrolase family protein [Candidatus Cardinium hertigii]
MPNLIISCCICMMTMLGSCAKQGTLNMKQESDNAIDDLDKVLAKMSVKSPICDEQKLRIRLFHNAMVFGDSLSDEGVLLAALNTISNKEIVFSPIFHESRSLSNGPLTFERVVSGLNLPALTVGFSFPFSQGIKEKAGTNYAAAMAAATPGNDLLHGMIVNHLQLSKQIDAAIRHNPSLGKDDLCFIMILGNDIMRALDAGEREGNKIIDCAANELKNAINRLAEKGVTHIVVANAPNIGLIPKFVGTNKQALATALTVSINQKIIDILRDCNKKWSLYGVQVLLFDLFKQSTEIINAYDKKGYDTTHPGVTDVEDNFNSTQKFFSLWTQGGTIHATYKPPRTKENMDNAVFFDSFHPTGGVHKKLGNHILEHVIPKFEENKEAEAYLQVATTSLAEIDLD